MLSDKLTITLNGQKTELFMSFGLLQELTKIFGSTGNFSTPAMDHEMSDKIMRLLLVKRGRSGVLDVYETPEISTDDYFALMNWATEHALDFFIRATEEFNKTNQKYEERVKSLMPSIVGSKNSILSTESAGPSTSAEVN